MFLLSLVATAAAPQTQLHELIARARSLELDTPYVPPPGDPLAHHAAGYAKVICTAVFMTGLAPDFAAENVGYFTAPHEVRTELSKPVIDRTNKAVHITLPNGITRTAKYLGSQGCVTLPLGEDTVHFTPVVVKSKLPNADTMSWPMGDVLPNESLPGEIDAAKLKAAVDAAFEPSEALTAAFVVTWKGHLIAERYGDGIGVHTPLEGWSMGKHHRHLVWRPARYGRVSAHSSCPYPSRRLSLPAGLGPLHQFGTRLLAPMSHFPENYRGAFGPYPSLNTAARFTIPPHDASSRPLWRDQRSAASQRTMQVSTLNHTRLVALRGYFLPAGDSSSESDRHDHIPRISTICARVRQVGRRSRHGRD